MSDFQHNLFLKMMAERKANDELRRTDPAAYQAKMDAMLPVTTCSFCRVTFRGYGHNPSPLLTKGKACDDCNWSIVVKARLQAMAADEAADRLSDGDRIA
jgi:hypothetical protein